MKKLTKAQREADRRYRIAMLEVVERRRRRELVTVIYSIAGIALILAITASLVK